MHFAISVRDVARPLCLGALVSLLLGLFPAAPLHVARAGGGPNLRHDFNGDGFDDLAIGEPNAEIGGEGFAGRVLVLYGSRGGLTSGEAQIWSQNSEGIDDEAEISDVFGSALTVADFDGDGFSDLAVGVPGEDKITGDGNPRTNDGIVHVIYGSPTGLRPRGEEILEGTQQNENFGYSLAALDFFAPPPGNGPDGLPDLAVGSPGFNAGAPGQMDNAGIVRLHSASSVGFFGGNQALFQFTGPSAGAEVGTSLAPGDFGEGLELAMGAPGTRTSDLEQAGAVFFLDGSSISQDTSEVQDTAEPFDRLGGSVAAGDFDGDGHDDLAAAAPYEDLDNGDDAGLVNVLYGSSQGLTSHNNEVLVQQPDVLGGQDEDDDEFGFAVLSEEFGRGGQDDLAIGVPGENADRGLVHVVYGSPGGLGIRSAQSWTQASPGVRGTPQDADSFGLALGAGRFDRAGRPDLAIGIPREDVGGNTDAGAVAVLYSKKSGLTAEGDQLWHADSPGVPSTAAKSFLLGWTIYTSSDFLQDF